MLKINTGSNDPFGILKTTAEVLRSASFVQINPSKIKKLSSLVSKKLKNGIDENEYNLGLTGGFNEDLQLLLIENAVNFCFWAEKGAKKWKIEWPKGEIVSGGWFGLIAVFKRALAESVPVLDPEYLSRLTIDDVRRLFRSASDSEIPLIEKRLENLIEVGNVLTANFNGRFLNLVEEAKFDTVKIVKQVYDNFPSFKDVAKYNGKKVFFLKRAQILANDLSYVSKIGKKLNIKNLDKLTAFADYKVPQVLRHFGVINYSNNLAQRIDKYKLIPALSPEEIEIRAATVQGVDLVKQNLKKYTSSQIDNAIWLISQDQSKITKPYHRTYSIFY